MSNSPLVSVLVPIYNIEKYLPRCLDSLINQTLTDIEIVCVNDGSKDSSLSILEEYKKKDSRIVIVDKPNGGLPSARNAGLDAAKGEYVGFVDGDDFVNPDMFEVLYNRAVREDADIVVCGANPVPLDSDTPQWLKDALSPSYNVLRGKDCVSALFEVRGAQPFLWRNLVRREFIEKHGFRLDENIVVGEDTAFQFKLFPAAKKLVTISDKLYNYEHSRPESIMNSVKFKDYSVRLERHVNMICSIAKNWRENDFFNKKTAKYFFEWAIDFIYWDLIRVSASDKARIASAFCRAMVEYGYYANMSNLEYWVRDHFEQMQKMAKAECEKPEFSVVVLMNNSSDYIADCLSSILSQTKKDVEILLYNNGADEVTYRIAFDLFSKNPRISLRNSPWQAISVHYNDAITTAKGDYIIFLSAYDKFTSNTALEDMCARFKANDAVDLVGIKDGKDIGEYDIKAAQNCDYHKFAYRVSKIRENAILFSDYALLTGRVFFTKYCLKSSLAAFTDSFIERSEKLYRGAIYATESALMLKAVLWMLEAGLENGLSELCEKIADWLDYESTVRLISDSIGGYVIDNDALHDESKDVHANILELLFKINALVPRANRRGALIKPLMRYMDVRHSYLHWI